MSVTSHRNPNHWHLPLLAVAVCATVTVVFVSLVATIMYIKRANDVRRLENYRACVRGNSLRANVNKINAHFELGLPVLLILDCSKAIR